MRGSTKSLGSDFRGSEQNFTIGQNPKIYGNFSKIWIEINKNLEKLIRNLRKMQIFRNFLVFTRDYGKNKEYNIVML